MRRLAPVFHLLGLVLVIFALTMLLPLAIALSRGNDAAMKADLTSLAITLASGGALWLATRKYKRELQVRDGFLLVALTWSVLPAFGTLPLLFFLPELTFTDAYFETVSGVTTTGATVLSGLDALPASLNFWRMELQWLGGMGLIVLAVAILPLLGVGGSQLYRAETPGPMKDAKLTPRIAQTAKGLWLVYVGITVACIVSFQLAGMTWLDAVMHGFTTVSTAGFSSHDASFAYFDSPVIEAVAIVFMLVGAMNFASHFLVFRNRSLNPYVRDPEAKWFLLITLGSCLMLALYLWQFQVYPDFWSALRFASFNTVSIATTTGHVNTDYNQWPIFGPLWMLLLCCFAASAGSTGGGIKMVRALLLYKQLFHEMVRTMHPNAAAPVKLGGQPVPNNIIFAVLAFMSVYGVSIVSMTLILTASGLDAITAFSAVVASINNTGPGLNEVGPATNYAGLADFQTWVCTFAMLLGRLELFTLLIVLHPKFWQR
ncbi:MAG: TrkH family potassium uptake protein [Burkholderiales bacterium]